MGDVDSDAFEAVPREFAVKADQDREVTPKAPLRKSPLSGGSPSASVSCSSLEQRLAEGQKE